jgi:hypothetical protein
MKFNYMLLFPIAFITMLMACDSHKPKSEWYDFTSRAYLSDSLPPEFLQKVNPIEHQGIRLQRALGATTYYFEYSADHQTVLKEISTLPFAADSARADTQVRMIAGEIELRKIERLLKDESIIKDFSIDALDGYTAYECLKTPQHHILLLSKNSDRVIHIVHQV